MCIDCSVPGLLHAMQRDRGSATELPPAAADHHLHIQSSAVGAELKREAERSPEPFALLNPDVMVTRGAPEALAALDAAGIAQGVLLSMAYVLAPPGHRAVDAADIAKRVREENAYNVESARMSNRRLTAFIGVNPLWDGASDELRHWSGRDHVGGVKLHLGHSAFDATNRDGLRRLGEVFAQASDAGLALVVHLRGRGVYTAVQTQNFIEQVLPHAGGTTVQIAHGGGGGGLDEDTVSSLSLLCAAIGRDAPGTRQLIIDLSVVLVRDISDPASAALAKSFVSLARRVGLSRFVVGSDWPSLMPPREHNHMLQSQLPFEPDEWKQILGNRAPYLSTPPSTKWIFDES